MKTWLLAASFCLLFGSVHNPCKAAPPIGGAFNVTKISLGVPSFAVGVDDFDGDGKLDIVNWGSDGNIRLLTNDGSNHFSSSIIGSVAYTALASGDIGTADFNADGSSDFAVTDGSDTIHIFINNMDGSFSHSKYMADRSILAGIDCADINGDSKADIAVAGYDPPEVLIYYGNGDGTFIAGPRFNPGDSTSASVINIFGITVGDFNKDGLMDIIAGQDDDGDPGAAWLFAGKGDGSYSYIGEAYDTNPVDESGIDLPGGGFPDAFDIDADGNLEIITSRETWGCCFPPGTGLFFNGNGTGIYASCDTIMQSDSLLYVCSTPPTGFPPRNSFYILGGWTSDTALLVTYDLIGYWPMDEMSGDTIGDSSGNSFNGLAPNTSIAPGIIGNCRVLNGMDAEIDFDNCPEFNLVTPFSFAMWMKVNNPQDWPFIFSNAGDYRGFWFRIGHDNNSDSARFDFNLQGDWLSDGPQSQTVVHPGVWYHVAGVAKSDTELELYVNGHLDGQKTISPGYIATAVRNLKIGIDANYYEESPALMNGAVDEVRLFAKALTPEEIEPLIPYVCGDANRSGTVNALDITHIINYLYKHGQWPIPPRAADVNNSGIINALDITYLINYLYKHGPAPNCGSRSDMSTHAKLRPSGFISAIHKDDRTTIELTSSATLAGLEMELKALDGKSVNINTTIRGFEPFYSQDGDIITLGMFDLTGNAKIALGKNAILKVDGNVEIVSVLGADESANGLAFDIINGASKIEIQPTDFALLPNHPNPFNPTTQITFALPKACEAILEVYNIAGQKVATLVDGTLEAGEHTVQWDSRDQSGASVASGIYLYRLTAGEFKDTKKMILLK